MAARPARAPLPRTLTPRERLELTVRASPSLPFLVVGVGILVWFTADEGGFLGTTFPARWPCWRCSIVALLALPRPAPPRPLAAVALFAGYAAWSYLSMLWAGQPEWPGRERTGRPCTR